MGGREKSDLETTKRFHGTHVSEHELLKRLSDAIRGSDSLSTKKKHQQKRRKGKKKK